MQKKEQEQSIHKYIFVILTELMCNLKVQCVGFYVFISV